MTDAEETLVRASQQGDRGAFEQLVRRTARLVYGRLYLETGDAHRTEDLVQETYLQAWRSIEQVGEAGKFRAWLLAIAHSRLMDSGRRQMRVKRSGPTADAESLKQVADAGSGPAEQAERSDQRQQALAALGELPEEYRQVLMLRYLGGADYQTISRQLALSNGSLRGLLHRGLAMLREKMTGERL